jgi:hypothetical protein
MTLIKHTNKYIYLICLVFLLIASQNFYAQEVLWFSNIPPKHEKRIVASGMHKLSSMRGKRGQSSIIQWLRKGASINNAEYVQLGVNGNTNFYLFSPSHQLLKVDKKAKDSSTFFTYASKEEGYYNAYLENKYVSGDTLYITVAKSEMLNHSCRNGHPNVQKIIGPHTYPNKIDVEIVRKRKFTEDFHYFATSSDEVEFTFLVKGKPIPDAKLTFVTQTGWNKSLNTNEKGSNTFQIIQDYFTNWQEIDNRKIFYYMIYGEKTVPKSGIYKEKSYSYIHYITSLSDGYRPAKTMYLSMFWAFAVFVLISLISIAGVFIYRMKRYQIYKEIKLDEKN